jgi:enoyl-CoA hydratase/carnithine racemase
MSTGKISSLKGGGIGHLIFDNPERRNAVSRDMVRQVPEILADFEQDPDIRVILVSGAGDKSFISGADISEFEKTRANAQVARESSEASMAMFEGLREFPKPTVAKIRGYCFGGGVALACACDLRVAADDALFAIPAARLGIGYRAAFTRWVTDAVGPANAKEILLTARRYDAAEALRIGLVHRVVPVAEFDGFVTDYAAKIAENAPLSMAATKVIVNEVAKGLGSADLDLCAQQVDRCAGSEDFIEGRRAFMEKRRPDFHGR